MNAHTKRINKVQLSDEPITHSTSSCVYIFQFQTQSNQIQIHSKWKKKKKTLKKRQTNQVDQNEKPDQNDCCAFSFDFGSDFINIEWWTREIEKKKKNNSRNKVK